MTADVSMTSGAADREPWLSEGNGFSISKDQGYIAKTMGDLGVEAVEFADGDGNVSHTIDCKPNLKFIFMLTTHLVI